MTGIKRRWVKNYILIVFITMMFIECIVLFSIRNYYYSSIEQNLLNRVQITTGFYNQYLSNEYFEDVSRNIVKDFISQEQVELQVLDKNGNVIRSSNGFSSKEKVKTTDYINALRGKTISYQGFNKVTNEKIMSASSPIVFDDQQIVGVIRFITSLEQVDLHIEYIYLISFVIVALIIILMLFSSLIFSKSIINPINEITAVSKKMAKGEYSARIEKKYDDEIGELADTLNYMASEINKSEELKNEFISSVSHELRTPLTSIKGWGETILTGDLDDKEEAKLGLKIIVRETDRLKAMVEELLDFARLERGKMTLNLETFDLKKELDEIVTIFRAKAFKKRILIKDIISDSDVEIRADKNRIKQVFINIIDNAIKFSDESSEILIKIYSENEFINIEVIDQGIGISKEQILKVKEKFFKGDAKKQGSGLGLSISNEIVTLHKGILVIESEKEKGTKVKIKLPK